jgi:GNAT superfamily N-acetyltransferase
MKPRIILKLHNFDPKTTFVLIGKEYNFAIIVDFNSLGVLRKILGNVIFSYSSITDLGNLTTIGGRANFTYSEITDLANLTTIGGSVNFKGSKVIDLGNLQTIGGDANFVDNEIENLGQLTTIGGGAYFSNSQVTDLGNLTTIGGNGIFLKSKVENLGNLQSIGGNAYFQESKITDLGNLTTIGGDANFRDSQITDLGKLTTIGSDADFKDSQITDLGNLTTIGGNGIFLKSKVENLGNLQSIGGNASFVGSKITDLSNLTTIGGDAVFGNSPIMDLVNLQTIGGDAYFNDSQITDLGNLTTIEGDAYFEYSEIMDLGNLQTIGGRADFGDREDLKEEWERRQNKYKKGGRTISQTPAPKKDQIKGSDKNKAGSSKDTESAKQIKFNEKTLNSIQNKVDEHNKQYPNKKITLESAKAVVRRGMGAYSQTYRPTISGGKPNSRVAWGLARLNAFIYKIINGKSKSGKYSQDNDLIEELGYKVEKYEIGGIFQGTPYDFNVYSTEFMGTGEGNQTFGWGLYFTDQKAIAERYAYTPNENSFYINGISLKNSKQFTQEEKHIILNIWRELWEMGYSETSRDYLWEILNEIEQKSILLDLEDESVFDKETILEINVNIEIYNRLYDKLKNESLQIKSNVVNVTLFKGKNPKDYDLMSWNDSLEKNQYAKILIESKKIGGIYLQEDWEIDNDLIIDSNALYPIAGNTIYDWLSATLGSDKKASLFLLGAGIDGIKYKAGTLSGMEDEEGYNYVIFNADDVTIEGKEKYADGGEINKNMKNEIIEILSKNARYGTNIFDLQEVGFEVIKSCIESNTYFGNAIKQANENYIMIPVKYDDKLWAIDKKVEYVYYAKPNQNTKIRVEYKYDMQDYPTPVLFDSETMNNEEFHDVNDYEEINVEEFDSEFLYRGINNNEMLSIIENGFIKSNASMNIGEQQENTTSFAQHISQASSYAVGFNAWFDEVTFAKPKYILKVKKEGVNYKPTIETDVENEVDVFGEIPIQQIESIYEIKLGECQMGMVEINVGYKNDFSEGSRFPMFKKVFVRKTDISTLINEIDSKNKIEKNREHLPNNFFSDGGLIAPNGKPSNLTPEQYKLVRTPEFKAWFGDWENNPENASKVVDENGEPKVVWRGESKDFNKFDYKKLGSRLKTAWRKAGFYFAPTKSSAEQYMFFMGTRILKEFFLNIRNPYTLDSNEFYGVMDWGSLPNQRFKTNKSATDYANSQVEMIKSKNHDGFFVTILEDDNTVEIVAFEPNQIKLADGSNTTFDSNNPDIRFDGGGGIKKIKFDIEEDDEEQRITISIKNIGEVILVVTYPEYEFLEDVGEDGLEELGVEEGDMIGKIEHLEIEDKYKGQGYAKLLMNKAIEIAKEKGLMPLYLNASPMGSDGLDIDALTIFYEKLGFQVFLEQGGNNLMIFKETYNNGGLMKRRSRKRNQ